MSRNREISHVLLSFIVIGKNESRVIGRCLRSILECVEKNNELISSFDIIYVDSDSRDNTLEIVRGYKDVHVLPLAGRSNAALGRNTGANASQGKILFFIDGDMEIHPEFLSAVITPEGKLIHPYISGQFINYYYDIHGKSTGNEPYIKNLTKDRFEYSSGGLFFLERKLWDELGGMRTPFTTGEDLDLGLRLAKRGIFLLRKKDVLAKHHTIHYHSMGRMWKDIPKGVTMYSRGMLYRQHIFNKYMYKRLIKSDPTACLLAAGILLAVVFFNIIPLLAYLFICGGIITFMFRKTGILYLLNRIIYQYVRDILTLFSFLFLYPRSLNPVFKDSINSDPQTKKQNDQV